MFAAPYLAIVTGKQHEKLDDGYVIKGWDSYGNDYEGLGYYEGDSLEKVEWDQVEFTGESSPFKPVSVG